MTEQEITHCADELCNRSERVLANPIARTGSSGIELAMKHELVEMLTPPQTNPPNPGRSPILHKADLDAIIEQAKKQHPYKALFPAT